MAVTRKNHFRKSLYRPRGVSWSVAFRGLLTRVSAVKKVNVSE
jgi:hypothetical protein